MGEEDKYHDFFSSITKLKYTRYLSSKEKFMSHKQDIWKCTKCTKSFHSYKTLRAHLMTSHAY